MTNLVQIKILHTFIWFFLAGCTSVVAFQLWYGVARSQHTDANTQRLSAFLAGPLEWTSFDEDDAREAGALRAELEIAGRPTGAYDVLIAGQARRRGATLVTSNVSIQSPSCSRPPRRRRSRCSDRSSVAVTTSTRVDSRAGRPGRPVTRLPARMSAFDASAKSPESNDGNDGAPSSQLAAVYAALGSGWGAGCI
jgi:predicted nucleic acid-binding protein